MECDAKLRKEVLICTSAQKQDKGKNKLVTNQGGRPSNEKRTQTGLSTTFTLASAFIGDVCSQYFCPCT